jgi:hypothetical protein
MPDHDIDREMEAAWQQRDLLLHHQRLTEICDRVSVGRSTAQDADYLRNALKLNEPTHPKDY